MKASIKIIAISTALALSGCATMSQNQKDSAKGAGMGGLAGAVIGAIADGSKGALIGAGVGAIGGAIVGNIWSKQMEEQKIEIEQTTAGTGVAVTQTEDNQLKLEIPSDISFDINRSEIKPDFRPVLDKFAESLVANPATNLLIVGHTDSTGNDAINNPLSINRAASTRDYLISRGVAASRISIEGRGSREPLVSNDTVENRTRNRRVEIFVAEPAPANP